MPSISIAASNLLLWGGFALRCGAFLLVRCLFLACTIISARSTRTPEKAKETFVFICSWYLWGFAEEFFLKK